MVPLAEMAGVPNGVPSGVSSVGSTVGRGCEVEIGGGAGSLEFDGAICVDEGA